MTANLAARLSARYRQTRPARMARRLTRRLGERYVGRCYGGPTAAALTRKGVAA